MRAQKASSRPCSARNHGYLYGEPESGSGQLHLLPQLAGIVARTDFADGSGRGRSPLDQNPLPHLVTKRWVYDQYHSWWHGDEGSSPNWLARVLLRFPEQAQNALIKLSWLERAKRRAAEQPVIDDGSGPLVAGVDVGGGESETVVYVCECKHDRRRIMK